MKKFTLAAIVAQYDIIKESCKMPKAGKKLSLINGLVAIGNMAHEKYKDLEELTFELTNSRMNHTPEQELLDLYAPLYKQACEQHELLETKLGTAWKTRAKGYNKRSLTIGDLFELISSLDNKEATKPTQQPSYD